MPVLMPKFLVTIETRDGYQKLIDAESAEKARAIVESDDSCWGTLEDGWEHTDDSYAAIERIEAICSACGAVKPDGQSCGCFDNGSE